MPEKPPYQPPNYALRIFRRVCRPEYLEDIEGDLMEQFNANIRSSSLRIARWKFIWQIVLLLRPAIVRSFLRYQKLSPMFMLKHHLRIGWRILWKFKSFSAINLSGLALGMAVAMAIALWISDELKYDQFHHEADHIFKVMRHVYSGTEIQTSDRVTYNIARELMDNYSGIREVAITSNKQEIIFGQNGKSMREEGFYATSSFLDIFTWQILAGDTSDLLNDPSSILISESLARRYFGPKQSGWHNIVGQTIQHNIPDLSSLTVAGILRDIPSHSSLQFDFILPLQIYEKRNPWLTTWDNSGPHIYISTHEGADWETISRDMVDIQNEHIEGFRSDLFLHPFQTQHLYSSFKNGKLQGGRIQYLKIFGLVALMIIIIACINFMNLSTARSTQRSKEIGVRKTVGAGKTALVAQFIGESFVLTLFSFVVALALLVMALPLLNEIAQKDLTIAQFDGFTWISFGLIGVVTALLASAYPAFYFSSLSLSRIFRGASHNKFERSFFRRGLVVFQFTVSFLLIVGTLAIYQQIRFIHQKDLGFDRDHILALPLEGSAREKYETYRTELLKQPGILQVGAASESPLEVRSKTHSVKWSGKDPHSEISNRILAVDAHLTQTLGMQIVEGQPLPQQSTDASDKYLINERAAGIMEFQHPIGEQLSFWGGEGTIVGVVKDFHMASFYQDIEPMILWLRPGNVSDLFVRTKPGQLEQAIESLELIHRHFNVDYPFTYSFLDAEFDEKYRSEQSIATLSLVFTGLVLFIACLGLFGLTIYIGQQRLKEISIRKILGASVAQMVYLLSRDFIHLILMAIVIAAPLAYLLTQGWLNNFSYRVSIGVSIFIVATGTLVLLTMSIVGIYGLRISTKNPIQALQSE